MAQQKEVLYEESQRFRQWWVWLILVPINILWVAAIYQQMLQGIPFGDNPMPDAGLVVLAISCMLVSMLVLSFHLKTQITTKGISVRLFPVQLSFQTYSWDEIRVCYIRTYKPISEYGGWGYRLGIFGRGRALNISGNKGLQLEFDNKRKLLIGTQRPGDIEALLQKIGKLRLPSD